MRVRPSTGEWVEDPGGADYARAAAAALGRGDHREALELAVAAFCVDPVPAHERMVDRVIDETPRALESLRPPRDRATFYGALAGYARALARRGRVAEASALLIEAVAACPDSPVLAWADRWTISRADAQKVASDELAARLVELERAAAATDISGPVAENLERAERVGERVARWQLSPRLDAARSRILRRLGRWDDAVRLLESSPAPRWELAVERAAICADQGDDSGRVHFLTTASALRPEEVGTWIDLGEARLACGAIDQAAAAFAKARDLDSGASLSTGLHAYARALAGGRPLRAPEILEDAIARAGEEDRRLLLPYALDLDAYERVLVDPVDPLLAVLRSFAAHAASGTEREIVVRARSLGPLAPSARLAFHAIRESHRRDATLEVRSERAEGSFGPLFDARGIPLPERPTAPVERAISAVASSPFEWGSWVRRAREAATTLDAPVDAIIAGIAHPAPAPSEEDLPRQVHRYQIAAALVAAASDPTRATEAMFSIAGAIDDWSSIAALLALRMLADDDLAIERALDALVLSRAEALPIRDAPLPLDTYGMLRVGPVLRPELLRLRAARVRERRSARTAR